MREFEEETRISKHLIRAFGQIKLQELFIGTNGKTYSSKYFLCETTHLLPQPPMQYSSNSIIRPWFLSDEISSLHWATPEEAKYMIKTTTKPTACGSTRAELIDKCQQYIAKEYNFETTKEKALSSSCP
jgi:hypothetical protein